VERSARRAGNVVRVFPRPVTGFRDLLGAMRCYQWVKNLLLFVPAITSHTIFNVPVASKTALAFFAFALCASAGYILNDLLDLDEDRRHKTKKNRALASGRVTIGAGFLLAFLCLTAGALIARFLPIAFAIALTAYIVISVSYSVFLKRLLVVDVLALAVLYTLRDRDCSFAVVVVFRVFSFP
jgi:4-hydroxybenzoate polyprenyltransferase